jgi:hypothetical protein
MFKIFEIKEGKFETLPQVSRKKIKGFFIISAAIAIISLLSGWLNISEKQLWKYYELLLEQLNLKYEVPGLKNNQNKIDARAELVVDRALDEATAEYDRIIAEADKDKYKPKYVDGVNDETVCYTDECKTLAPPMRICAPWVDDCPKE